MQSQQQRRDAAAGAVQPQRRHGSSAAASRAGGSRRRLALGVAAAFWGLGPHAVLAGPEGDLSVSAEALVQARRRGLPGG